MNPTKPHILNYYLFLLLTMAGDVKNEISYVTQVQLQQVFQDFKAQLNANMNVIQSNIAENIVKALRGDVQRRRFDGTTLEVAVHDTHGHVTMPREVVDGAAHSHVRSGANEGVAAPKVNMKVQAEAPGSNNAFSCSRSSSHTSNDVKFDLGRDLFATDHNPNTNAQYSTLKTSKQSPSEEESIEPATRMISSEIFA